MLANAPRSQILAAMRRAADQGYSPYDSSSAQGEHFAKMWKLRAAHHAAVRSEYTANMLLSREEELAENEYQAFLRSQR